MVFGPLLSNGRQRVGGVSKTRVSKKCLKQKIFVYSGNAGTACVLECVLKTLACRGLRVGPSKNRKPHKWKQDCFGFSVLQSRCFFALKNGFAVDRQTEKLTISKPKMSIPKTILGPQKRYLKNQQNSPGLEPQIHVF